MNSCWKWSQRICNWNSSSSPWSDFWWTLHVSGSNWNVDNNRKRYTFETVPICCVALNEQYCTIKFLSLSLAKFHSELTLLSAFCYGLGNFCAEKKTWELYAFSDLANQLHWKFDFFCSIWCDKTSKIVQRVVDFLSELKRLTNSRIVIVVFNFLGNINLRNNHICEINSYLFDLLIVININFIRLSSHLLLTTI